MAKPDYIATDILLDTLKRQVEGYAGNLLDAVVFFRRDPADALEARFGSDAQLRKGICAMRIRRYDPRGPLANSGMMVNAVGMLEVVLIVPNGTKSKYDAQVQMMNRLADVFRWEVFYPENVNDIDSAFYKVIQKVESAGDEDFDLDPSLLSTAMAFQIVPQRQYV